jgi:RND superfamily putative drug exporter
VPCPGQVGKEATHMASPSSPPNPARRRRAGIGRYARVTVALRFAIVPAWILIALWAFYRLPPLSPTSTRTGFQSVVSSRAAPIRTELKAVHEFGLPLLAQTVLVQHRAAGLPTSVQERTVTTALNLDRHGLPGLRAIAAAVPLTNALGAFPTSRQKGTTALTYLFFRPGAQGAASATSTYARRYLSGPRSGYAGVTGPVVAENQQGTQISKSLPTVEMAAIVIVVVLVGLAFRSLLAPAITIVSAGIAYFISERVLEQAVLHLHIAVPGELDPVIVVLLLGIMTDYAVFFLAGFRDELKVGASSREGVLRSVTGVWTIVLTAGFTVAAGVAVIQTAGLPLFSQLGPGLAITVAISVLVSVTFVPACLGLFGRATYWPARPRPAQEGTAPDRRQVAALAAATGVRGAITRAVVRRPVAILALAVGVGGLLAGASQLSNANIGVNVVAVLPSSTPPARAQAAASKGFAPGILAPTEVVLDAPGVAHREAALTRLQGLMSKQSGVAGVLGPATRFQGKGQGLFVAPNGNAARYLAIFSKDPTGAQAVQEFDALRSAMPRLLRRAGLARAKVGYAGDTALSSLVVNGSKTALVQVGLLTLAIDFAILALFLRSLVAPLVLVAASALVVAASLGITTWVFVGVLHTVGFTFYVPFAAEVLLISFGSDYNLFLVGRIWEEVAELPLRQAISAATAEASFAINTAGTALAGTFAMLALVTLGSFRQFALAMFAGLLIDTFVVRSLLVPSSLTLLGRVAGWPSRRLARAVPTPARS